MLKEGENIMEYMAALSAIAALGDMIAKQQAQKETEQQTEEQNQQSAWNSLYQASQGTPTSGMQPQIQRTAPATTNYSGWANALSKLGGMMGSK